MSTETRKLTMKAASEQTRKDINLKGPRAA
ncbi:MAG: hypothetical protein ACD_47C00683G0001 [uncultured bacterium]|nr:MAG: hypothetical protein ACD_47C00683G0001 [uncultured bacterium]